jgi:NADH-quinone oxidoreductase subunit J
MTLHAFLFYSTALLTALCAITMVLTENIVRAAAWLLFTLAGVSGLFFLLGAEFVGATQLLVYVGGTLVLVVFGVMLTAQGPFITMRTSAAEWAVSAAVGLLFFGMLAVALGSKPMSFDEAKKKPPTPGDSLTTTSVLGQSLLGVTEATPRSNITGVTPPASTAPASASGDIAAPFQRERKQIGYLLPFEIVSVHLLVVLIGAAYLARAKRRRGVDA